MPDETSLRSNPRVLWVVWILLSGLVGWMVRGYEDSRYYPVCSPCVCAPTSTAPGSAQTSGANSPAITGGSNSITYPEKEK